MDMEEQKLKTQSSQIARNQMIQYLLFFMVHCIIDIVLLIFHMDNLKYIVAKLTLDIIVLILISTFNNRINDKQINIFLAVTKLSTLLIIAIIGYDVILLFVFIAEINTICEYKREYLLQRIITKTGGLIILIISSSILDIIIILFIILMEMSNVYAYFHSRNVEHQKFLSHQSRTIRESSSFNYMENNWTNMVQILPVGIIIFSIKDLKITFSNQICFQYFNGQCENQSQLEEFVLDKLRFQIVKCNNLVYNLNKENELKSKTSLKMDKNFTGHISGKEFENELILITDTLEQCNNEQSLRTILQVHLNGNNSHDQNQMTNTLELQCQQSWDMGTQSFYSCQLNVNMDENLIQFVLLDITQYHQFQVDLIQDEFKTQIVQSFSHELRTPLNSACNFLQCCLANRSIQKETKSNLIKPAYNALRLQAHLINDIIDFNGLYVHDIELEFKEFFIKDLIDEVHQLFKSSIEMKKLALYVDLFENTLHTITTDFPRLMQILVNVLQNAIKYSNSGIIILKLSNFSSQHLKFTIKDQGIGINEDRFAQIQRMLQIIEIKKGFSKYQKWHGFGLLISQMLLSKLCPKNFTSLLIRSGGKDKGTKVSFYIKNYSPAASTPSSSGQNKINTIRQISQIKVSFQSITKQISINGTMIQIADFMASQRNLNWMKNATIKSNDYSQIVDSYVQNEVDNKMNCLNHVQPLLITDVGVQQKRFANEPQVIDQSLFMSARDLQTQKVVSFKKLKLQDDYDSDNLIKQIFNKRKCTCKRILSVDDEIFNQKSIQYLLSQHGFDVILAFNGEEAIKTINQIERCSSNCILFMVVLMDYQMPIMDGLKTTKAFRQMMQQKIIPQIHIVGLTAFNGKKDIQICIEAGMSDVLAKPLKIKELFEILNLF